jgi:hypothetical protein
VTRVAIASRAVDVPAGAWPFLVPQVDEDGNEIGGIRLAIVPLLGSLIPFAKTRAERRNDPRKSLEERYRGKSDYLGRATAVGLALVKEGYVLREDLPYLLERAAAGFEWAMRVEPSASK